MKRLVILFAFLFLLSLVQADFSIGNLSHFVETVYGPEENLRGWINISLEAESVDSQFEDSEGNSIKLIDLLGLNKNYNYDCSPSDCGSDYSADSGATSKNFFLNAGESKIMGFKFSDVINSISAISFSLQSSAGASCYNQMEIDFFNDETTDSGNNKSSSGSCSSLYGCFNSSKTLNEFSLSSTPFCQKIELSESPGFNLGAWIKKNSGSLQLTMELFNRHNEKVGGCLLPEIGSEGEYSCSVDYLVINPENYYVCIYSSSGTGDYKIRGYSSSEGCGFYGTPIQVNTPAAYQIFAKAKQFGSVGTLEISKSESSGNSLASLVTNYIDTQYKGMDCSGECIVPIKFYANTAQTVTLSKLSINYVSSAGPTVSNSFYELSEAPAKISSDFQKLELNEGNFTLQSEYGTPDYEFKLAGTRIFSEELSIEEVPKISSLSPITTISAFPTKFKVQASSKYNLTKFTWEFGDDKTGESNENTITHTYNSTGNYSLKLTAFDSNNRSASRTFKIDVGSPKEVINSTINQMQEDLSNVISQMNAFSSFEKDNLDAILNTTKLDGELKKIYQDYVAANSEGEYNGLMQRLLELKIPESIQKTTSTDEVLFYPDREDINPEVLQEITGGNYTAGDEEKYIDAILLWSSKNAEIKITFKKISARYEESEEPLLRFFLMSIKQKNNLGYNFYLLIQKLENLKFRENYAQGEELGYTYIELKNPDNSVEFSTTEDVNFLNLPAFVSPALSRLVISSNLPKSSEGKQFKWTLFLLIIFLIFIVGLVIYLILQEWYKKKYEKYLFKNPNSLYNLVNYIENSRKSGLDESQILSKLKKSGWSSEQIRYVMRKYVGKKTGMLEIPVGKILGVSSKNNVDEKTSPRGY